MPTMPKRMAAVSLPTAPKFCSGSKGRLVLMEMCPIAMRSTSEAQTTHNVPSL